MESESVWQALERGGARIETESSGTAVAAERRLSRYNGLLDPAGAEAMAGALAEKLTGREVTLVVVWEDAEDIVLGFVVGQRLGVPILRTFNADGLVGHAGSVPQRARAVLVSDCLRTSSASRAVSALLDQSGGQLLGVAALVETGAEEAPLLASLVSLVDRDTSRS